jgi:hypothetical protein
MHGIELSKQDTRSRMECRTELDCSDTKDRGEVKGNTKIGRQSNKCNITASSALEGLMGLLHSLSISVVILGEGDLRRAMCSSVQRHCVTRHQLCKPKSLILRIREGRRGTSI